MKSIKYRLYFKILETRATFRFTHVQVVIMLLLGLLAKTVMEKSWKFSRLFCQDQDQDQDFCLKTKTRTKTLFLSSRRLETKTLVSRTTSLPHNKLNVMKIGLLLINGIENTIRTQTMLQPIFTVVEILSYKFFDKSKWLNIKLQWH